MERRSDVILPIHVVLEIVFGYLNSNILGFLMGVPFGLLQNAVIMENSSRRIVSRDAVMSLSQMDLKMFVLKKTGGLKNIRGYITRAELNSREFNDLQQRHLFSLNNGLTHKFYIITAVKEDSVSCLEINKYRKPEPIIQFISRNQITIAKTTLETSILFDAFRSPNIGME